MKFHAQILAHITRIHDGSVSLDSMEIYGKGILVKYRAQSVGKATASQHRVAFFMPISINETNDDIISRWDSIAE